MPRLHKKVFVFKGDFASQNMMRSIARQVCEQLVSGELNFPSHLMYFKVTKKHKSITNPAVLVPLLQVRWAELTRCSTRFPPGIVATLRGQLVLPALLATRDPAESPDNLVDLVSLETRVYLEVQEKEVLYLFFVWMFGLSYKEK